MRIKIGLMLALVTLLSSVASAQQYTTTPNIYGQPQFGTTTRGPYGQVWQTTPNIYGQPQFGTTSHGSNGRTCRTMPNIYGHPEMGTTTSCN